MSMYSVNECGCEVLDGVVISMCSTHIEEMNRSMFPEYRVIVAGSRGFNDYNYMCQSLNAILGEKAKTHRIVIVSGTAGGADTLGESYGELLGYEVLRMPAEWKTYGKSAGYRRNEDMAKIAHACVVFWDGVSKGTSHMIDLAKRYQLPLRIKRY